MIDRPQPGPPSVRNALIGAALVARGRRAGFALFGASKEAFLASLAPLIAFPLVGAVLMAASGHPLSGIRQFLPTLCALLAPLVFSQLLAQRWGRDQAWLGYATAFNWCQLALPAVAAILLLLVGLLFNAGLPEPIAVVVFVTGLGGYALWLHWFISRHALGLGPGRAALLVVLVNLATAALILGPQLLLQR